MYSIIEFEDGILAIPSIWLLDNGKMCWYPPPEIDVKRAIKSCTAADRQWSKHGILRKFGTAKDYKSAVEKQNFAIETSDIEDAILKKSRAERRKSKKYDDSDMPMDGTRKNTRVRKRQNDNGDTDESQSDDDDIQRARKQKKVNTDTDSNSDDMSTPKRRKSQKGKGKDVTNGDSESELVINSQSAFKNITYASKPVNQPSTSKNCNKSTISDVTNVVHELQNDGAHSIGKDVMSVTGKFKIKDSSFLTDCEKLSILLIDVLSKRRGKEYTDLTNNILYKVMSSQLAEKYSYKGRQKKLCFSDTCLSSCIIQAVRILFPNTTEYDIEVKIGSWLANAPTRLGRKEKLNTSTANEMANRNNENDNEDKNKEKDDVEKESEKENVEDEC